MNFARGPARAFCDVVITMHVLLACPILLTSFSLGIERSLGFVMETEDSRQFTLRSILRISVLAAVAIIAISVPFFADFMNLIGAVANTLLIYIFPVVFHTRLTNRISIVKIIVLVVGILGGTMGTIDALTALYRDMYS